MEALYQKVSNFITEHDLINNEDHILIAFSSGRDSVALAHLLLSLNYKIALAHCNFKLRGQDSLRDEEFAKNWALTFNIPFHSIQFDTTAYAEKEKLSIQMAARELRYNWFKNLQKTHQYDKVATGHHQNDNIETILINLIRGTGISGMRGIPTKRDQIVRPILCLNRKEIDAYITDNKLSFREDITNDQEKYMRNKIRHKILPVLEELNPDVINTFFESARHIEASERIINHSLEQFKKLYISENQDQTTIDTSKLITKEIPNNLLFYVLKDYNFNAEQVKEIITALSNESGRQFLNNKYRLLVDRKKLLIQKNNTNDTQTYKLYDVPSEWNKNIKLIFQKQPFTKKSVIDINPSTAQLDFDTLEFPLCIRKWKKGDRFCPIGMKGSKLVSDFFIDQKLSLFEKEKTWILESNHKIVWIIGYRIDDRFKIRESTKNILKIHLEETNETGCGVGVDGGRKTEVGSRKSEVGSRKSEVLKNKHMNNKNT